MKSILYASAIVCACACVSVQAMEEEFTTITKYADSTHDTVEYADLHKLRDIFKQSYPTNHSVIDNQKRLVACCILQELGKAAQDYSENRLAIASNMQKLFGETSNGNPSEIVNAALMYLFEPQRSATKTVDELTEYFSAIQANISKLTTKRSQLQQLITKNDKLIAERQKAIKQESSELLEKKLQEAQQRKTTFQHEIALHTVADKILHKRFERTQQNLERGITSLQQELDGLTSSEDRQKRAELEKELHNAKSALAHSKGEGSFWNDLFGY